MTNRQIATKLALRAFAKTATKSIAFSVATLSFLTQSTVVYGQDAKRDQLWRFDQHPIPSDIGTANFEFKNNANLGLCLGVVGADTRPPRPGTPVEVFPCGTDLDAKDRRRDQLWRIDAADPGFVRIRNFVTPNYCLGVVGVDRPRPGSAVEIYNCFEVPGDRRLDNQWVIESNGTSQIRNRANRGVCLGVVGVDNPRPGSRAEVYFCR